MTIELTYSKFCSEVSERSFSQVSKCYQCNKCSNGCPITYTADIQPNQIMRLIQLGQKERVLKSKFIWICASCQTCSTRCPMEIDIANVMNTLREMSVENNMVNQEQKLVFLFHKMFLQQIKFFGRLNELSFLALLKAGSMDKNYMFSDLNLGPKLFFKGKLKLLPTFVHDKKDIKDIFDRIEKR